MAADNDWKAVVRKLRRGRQKWAHLTRVLGREGVDARTLGMLYVAVVKVVLLYGSETWMMPPRIPPQGGLQTEGTATPEDNIWEVGVSPSGGGDGGGRFTGG